MRILIVEDEVQLAETVARGLRRYGFAVDVAFDGAEGLEKATLNEYSVIVLDRDLPLLHGDDVCRELDRLGHRARVLMLTAAAGADDLVAGFAMGADDYLAKPFAFSELVARVQALDRRVAPVGASVLCLDDLVVDPIRGEVSRSGRRIELTAREFSVLVVLMRASGAIVSAEELLEQVWDEHADPFTTAVRVTVSRLRSKLGPPTLIATVVGRGYRL